MNKSTLTAISAAVIVAIAAIGYFSSDDGSQYSQLTPAAGEMEATAPADSTLEAIANKAGEAMDSAKETVGNAADATAEATSNAVEATQEVASDAMDSTKEAATDAMDATKEAFSGAEEATTEAAVDAKAKMEATEPASGETTIEIKTAE